jgi:UDP-N-acetyl-D-mannosaminuronic acid dehydrogenase
VVVRSTVPAGASREEVLPPLVQAWGSAHLVMAPERTIQGMALRELVELPQVVGGLDEESLELGLALFGGFSDQVVPVSSLETAELVKLTNNCHTDVIYAFGNEVARVTERLGLDPLEVIRAANLDYPRPDIAKPGYVGGGCLSKDPYIMVSSAERSGHQAPLISAARALNEDLPVHVAERVAEMIQSAGGRTLTVLGWAYKGWPPTDDMRGTPIAAMMPVFTAAGIRVLGHDPLVTHDVIRDYGGEPVELRRGFRDADAVLLITDHPEYRALDIGELLIGSHVRVVYDSWRILDGALIADLGVRYASLGYESAATTQKKATVTQ